MIEAGREPPAERFGVYRPGTWSTVGEMEPREKKEGLPDHL